MSGEEEEEGRKEDVMISKNLTTLTWQVKKNMWKYAPRPSVVRAARLSWRHRIAEPPKPQRVAASGASELLEGILGCLTYILDMGILLFQQLW